MVANMLDGIEVRLQTDYLKNKAEYDAMAEKVVYTGAIDAYFDYKLGALEYRSVRFEFRSRRDSGESSRNGQYRQLSGSEWRRTGTSAGRTIQATQAQNGEGQGASAGTASTDESQAQRGEVQGPPAGTASTGSSQAQSGEVQGPPAADGTTEGGKSADEAVTKPVNGTAATSFKEENSWYKSPFIWIGIATVLAVIGILGYHLKKR